MLRSEYISGDQVKKTEMGRACSAYGERRGAYRAYKFDVVWKLCVCLISARFVSRKGTPTTQLIEGFVGLTARFKRCGKQKQL